MKAFSVRVAVVVAGLTLAAGPVLAQSPKAGGDPGGGGGRGGGGGSSSGSGGGGGGGNIAGSVGGGSGGGDVSGGSSSSSPSMGSVGPSSSFGGSHGGMQMAAPVHRTSLNYSDNGSGQRTHTAPSNSSSSGERATPRASAPSGASSPAASGGSRTAAPRGDAPRNDRNDSTTGRSARITSGESIRTPAAGATLNNASGAHEVPSWSRSRGDRPITGTAVPRSPDNPPPDRNHGRYGGYYDPYYYDPYGVYGFYGFNGGYYGFYNPLNYTYGFGGYGLDPGFGFPYYSDPSSPYDYGEGYGSYSSRIYSGRGQGALKLKVKPRDAKVYVDGYYVGNVDQFDGAFQKLALNSGSHKVEVKADGYETAEFDVLITQDKTLTFAGDLKKLQ